MFLPGSHQNRKGAELVRTNTKNVLIETLSSQSLGLPPYLDPEMLFKNHGVYEAPSNISNPQMLIVCDRIAYITPSVLILTKIKRWTRINMSTYPPNLRCAPNDLLDIAFLVKLLDENGSKISFQLYHAQYPEILDQAVKDAVVFFTVKRLGSAIGIAHQYHRTVRSRAVKHIKDKTPYGMPHHSCPCLRGTVFS